MKSESTRPVTIEDLLRLKRAERPPAEFWSEFDRTLRAKQLSALVAKRPWWQTFPRALSSVVLRFRIPLGAAAAVAITFVSLQTGKKTVLVSAVQPTDTESASPVVLVGGPASETRLADVSISPASLERVQVAALEPAANEVSSNTETAVAASDPVTASDLSRLVALGGVAAEGDEIKSSASRAFADRMIVARNVEPVAAPRFLGDANNGFESRAMPARASVEPLQQMASPSETRRSRLMSAMVSTAVFENSARTTERAASRIAEERLYDQIQRFSARGDSLNMKF